MQINICRGSDDNVIFTRDISADDVATFTHSLKNEFKIVISWKVAEIIPINLGDYLKYNNVIFKLNKLPQITKKASNWFEYALTFESPVYDLYNKVFIDEYDSDFTYVGTPAEFVELITTNMNQIDSGWTIGNVDDADAESISFEDQSCREALNTIADTFDLEWSLNGKEISLVKSVGFETTLSFSYGKGNGLYQLVRQNIDDKNIVTRLYGFGSSDNLPDDYDGTRLRLPERYLEENVDKYGIIEGSLTNDDIKPSRTATITGVSTDMLQIVDDTLDFDLTAQMVSGTEAKLVIKTGDLAGYSFSIGNYIPSTKTIYINKTTEDDGTKYPNDELQIQVGDTYTLTGIAMPQSYVDTAVEKLRTYMQSYIDENSVPRVQYSLTLSELYAKRNGISLGVGDKITITDPDLNIDTKIRVSAISYPLYRPYNITATIADSVGYSVTTQAISKIIDNSKAISVVNRTQYLQASQTYMKLQDLRKAIYDPDGYFDGSDLKPNSVETLYLGVGSKSMAFILNPKTIVNSLSTSGVSFNSSQLMHYSLSIDGLGSIWQLDSITDVALADSNTLYYIYAKCSTSKLEGVWTIDSVKHTYDEEAGYYWLLCGVIYAVDSDTNTRDYKLINGYTNITGGAITTGTIQDLSGQNWIDLDTGDASFGNSTQGWSWSQKDGKFVINGGLISKNVTAEDGFFDQLVVTTLSTSKGSDTARLIAEGSAINFYPANTTSPALSISTSSVTNIDGSVSVTAGFMIQRDSYHFTYGNTQGLFSNMGSIPFLPSTTGTKTSSSILGILREGVSDSSLGGISAGVVGINQVDTEPNKSMYYGGYFDKMLVKCLDYQCRLIDDSSVTSSGNTFALDAEVSKVYCYNNANNIILTLPTMKTISGTDSWNNLILNRSRSIYVYQCRIGSINVKDADGTTSINVNTGLVANVVMNARGQCFCFTWTGVEWQLNLLGTFNP